jgi:hypothetical protein
VLSATVHHYAEIKVVHQQAYKSMFKASNWLFEPLGLTVKPVRRLTGILELPGIFTDVDE